MTEVTIYTVPPSSTCAKIANFLLAREVAHRLVTVEGEDELAAYESGELLRLVER